MKLKGGHKKAQGGTRPYPPLPTYEICKVVNAKIVASEILTKMSMKS